MPAQNRLDSMRKVTCVQCLVSQLSLLSCISTATRLEVDSMQSLKHTSAATPRNMHASIKPFTCIRPVSGKLRYRPAAGARDTYTTSTSDQRGLLFQHAASAAAAVALLFGSSVAPAVAFGPVSVKLDNINVQHIDCGAGISTVGGVTFSGASQKAACLDITASASNPSGKPLYNADVFGRVYDVNGEAAIDDTENIRIAYIDEIPPGTSKVEFKLFVPKEQYDLGPLSLQGFKATGFPGKMLPNTASGLISSQDQEVCEITGDCEDLAAEAAIR